MDDLLTLFVYLGKEALDTRTGKTGGVVAVAHEPGSNMLYLQDLDAVWTCDPASAVIIKPGMSSICDPKKYQEQALMTLPHLGQWGINSTTGKEGLITAISYRAFAPPLYHLKPSGSDVVVHSEYSQTDVTDDKAKQTTDIIDDDLIRQASVIAQDLGLSYNAIINVFLKAFIRHRGFPFPVQPPTHQTDLGLLRHEPERQHE